MTEQIDQNVSSEVESMDKKAALIFLNPLFWFAANLAQAAILYCAGMSLSEMNPEQLHAITIVAHAANFAIQLASQNKFGLSGNNVANVLQTENKVWNVTVLGGSYVAEAIGRNLNSVPNVLLQLGIIDNDYSGSALIAAQALASTSVSGLVYWLVANEYHIPIARGVQYVRSTIVDCPQVRATVEAGRNLRDKIVDDAVADLALQVQNMPGFIPR